MKQKVLFIIKRQLGYNGAPVPSKGLYNSALFVVLALLKVGVLAQLVEVVDGNDIDREVTNVGPTHCIIEALWVTPEKLAELRALHPRVKFIVRIHSNLPFLALEGIAIEWLRGYDVLVACNTKAAWRDLEPLLDQTPAYLPNIYNPTSEPSQKKLDHSGPNLWVGSLGSIRPLKNQLLQAVAALQYAEHTGRRLYFHINDRVEMGGEQVQKNLRALFAGTAHRLIEHPWCERHEDVLHIVGSLDLSLQVSFTETFNIASADAVWRGVPIVVSDEVYWAPHEVYAEPTSVVRIMDRMKRVEKAGLPGTHRNLRYLLAQNDSALRAWKFFLKEKEL